jgi:hypothetical protein
MRVLILGAGASISAGYPKAEELLDTLARDAAESGSIELREAWERWTEVVANSPEEVRPLLTARNPEVVLSVLDLWEMFIHENFAKVFVGDKGQQAADQSLYSDRLDRRLFSTPGHAWLHNTSTAKDRLIFLLGEYFSYKHGEDSEHPQRRAYLRALLQELEPGDVIVTLNWDTTVERTLLELGRWSPTDGYGFTKKFRDADEFGQSSPLAGSLLNSSEIVVLKLHGSVGWRSGSPQELLFDNLYLQYLLPVGLGATVIDFDVRPFHDTLPHALAYPSFLKRFENRFILDIWRQADEALNKTDAVEIWGYSLPPSDSAMRVLLLSLRSRARTGSARVAVHNPTGEHLDRFRQYFNGYASLDKRRLG